MPYDQRGEEGSFVARHTDDEIWSFFEKDPSVKRCADHFGYSRRHMRERLAAIRKRKGFLTEPDVDHAAKLEQLISSVPTDTPQGAELKELSVGLYGVAGLDKDRKWTVQGLDNTKAKYVFGKSALVAKPYKSPLRAYKALGVRNPKWERIFIVGDQQIGFWAVRDPSNPKRITFVPFHDERAIDVMLKALAVYRPDRVVVVGDFLDYPQLSRFQQEPEFAQTMQASIQEAYDLLRKIRMIVGPKCRIDFVPGNHETRMQRAIVNNNPALYNLTKPGEKWPIYSLPSLLKFDELRIECAAEYPSGEVWLAQRRGLIPGLVVTHADPKRKDMRADTIHGHLVLPDLSVRQVFYEEGPLTYTRMCVSGCGNYSDTSDKLRLTRTTTPSGRARMAAVQSFGTVDIDRETGIRCYGLHLIQAGRVLFGGKVIASTIGEGRGDAERTSTAERDRVRADGKARRKRSHQARRSRR